MAVLDDFLSQSYSQGIERISGTKHHFFDFRVPKQVLEVREKSWHNLFDKYTEEMSDNIEINVDTLEPEEDEISEEDYSYEHRVPMRKPLCLVQYWVDTGNLPCKTSEDKNDLSETGSSLSEKGSTSLQYSLNEIDTESKQKYKSDSSCSSVNTAAYILSNANITKKADTIAIIEGAKCIDIQSSKNGFLKDTEAVNNNTKCTETVKIDQIIHNNNNDNIIDVDTSDNDSLFSIMIMPNTSKTNNHFKMDAVIPNNIVQSESLQNLSCNETNKVDLLNTNEKSSDVQKDIHNIVSISQQFEETSKLLSMDSKSDNSSDEDESLERWSSQKQQMPVNVFGEEAIETDMNLTQFHRKKLYTARQSPVDLMLIKRHSINKLPKAQPDLHPALNTSSTFKRKISTVHKKKNKHHSFFNRRNSEFRKSKKHRRKAKRKSSSFSSIDVESSNDEINSDKLTSNSKIQDSMNSSLKNNHLVKQNKDCPIRNCNANVPVEAKIYKKDPISVNLNPVVLLERLIFSCKQLNEFERNSSSLSSIDVTDSINEINTEKATNSSKIQDSINSSFKNAHNNSAKQYKDVSIRKYEDAKIRVRKETRNQDLNPMVLLERITPSLKQHEFKGERNSFLSSIDIIDFSDEINSEETTNSSKMQDSINCSFQNTYNNLAKQRKSIPIRKYDTKVPVTTKIHKQDLNPMVLLKRITPSPKQHESKSVMKENTQINDEHNKREPNTTNKLHIYLVENLYDNRSKSKKANNRISSTSDTVATYKNQVFYDTGTMINSTFQPKDHTNQIKRDNSKRSMLMSISSDEDSLVQLIQPKKRLRRHAQKENGTLNISLAKNNVTRLSGNKQTFEKSNIRSSFNTQNIASTITKLFQTKSYYDSDSSET